MRVSLIKAGLREVNHTYDGTQRHITNLAHGFRKFFSCQLVEADLKPELRRKLEGHELKGNDSAYVLPTIEQLRREYDKAVDLLTINPENRLMREVQMLKDEKTDRIAKLEENQKILLQSLIDAGVLKPVNNKLT